jgi:hypothetical protein
MAEVNDKITTAIDENITISIPSRLHGKRTFHRLGFMPYVRRDGTETSLAIWRGTCVVCGAAFEVKTTARSTGSGSFSVVTCPQHRRQVHSKSASA